MVDIGKKEGSTALFICTSKVCGLHIFLIFFFSKDCCPFLGHQLKDLNCIFAVPGYDLAPEGEYM